MSNETNITSDTTKFAASRANEFNFSGKAEITGCSASIKDQIMNDLIVSAHNLSGTFGKSVTGGIATAAITGSPLAAGLMTAGIAINNLFSGGKGRA